MYAILFLLLVANFGIQGFETQEDSDQCNGDFDVVVLGSGISGTSAASILSQNGLRVAVVEQSPVYGGSLQPFTREGNGGKTYSFEPGMHVIVNDGEIFRKVSGRNIEMAKMGEIVDILYINSTEPLPLPAPKSELFKKLKEYFSTEELDEILHILETTKDFSLMMKTLLEKTEDEGLKFALSFLEYFVSFEHYPVALFNSMLDYEFGKDRACFPVGSSKRIMDGALEFIESTGKIYQSCAAESLDLEIVEGKHKIRGVNTKCGHFSTSKVVATIGVRNIFTPEFVGGEDIMKKYGFDERMKNYGDGVSGVVVYMGFNESNEHVQLPVGNVWYSSLEQKKEKPEVGGTEPISPDVIFSSCLSCRDPGYAKDRTDFFALSFIDYSWFEEWEDSITHSRPDSYYEYKKRFEDGIISWFSDTFPEAAKYLDLAFTSSPLTIRDYLGHPGGTIYGAELKFPGVSEWLKKDFGIEGLYVAGQDVIPGVYGSATSGVLTAERVIEDLKK